MKNKFNFRLVEYMLTYYQAEDILYHAELKDGKYIVTWESKDYPMLEPVEYTIDEVKDYLRGAWVEIN